MPRSASLLPRDRTKAVIDLCANVVFFLCFVFLNSMCISSEDKIVIFDRLVAWKAFLKIRLGTGIAVLIELRVAPATCRGELF